jgi:hypothetical protein
MGFFNPFGDTDHKFSRFPEDLQIVLRILGALKLSQAVFPGRLSHREYD